MPLYFCPRENFTSYNREKEECRIICAFFTSLYIFEGVKAMASESDFQKKLKKEISERFPGCYILKNDPTMIQGIPDLTILYNDRWAMLEVKQSEKARRKSSTTIKQQETHVARLNDMSFAAFIFPENKEDVLDAMERSFAV